MTKITYLALTILVMTAGAPLAAELTNGTVKKVDSSGKKVTLIHEELKNLEMPAMTMVFYVDDPSILAKMKEGSKIQFLAERVSGKLTVTQVK
jgi:Cu/Ag efflux protein CusF